jgi:two-component system OmpR family response regulator
VRLLVVEDDAKLSALLSRGLTEEGFAVDTAATAEDARWRAGEVGYDAIVLDLLLPDGDGFAVCRDIRSRGCPAPVLMLTALADVDDRVRGLDLGADDYLVKPFAFAELVARLRALLRRGPSPRSPVLEVGDLTLDPVTRDVTAGGVPVALTAKEFALLEFFMRRPGEAMRRSTVVAHVWDDAYDGDPHVVSVYVAYLRAKLDRTPATTRLETVRGVGYRLRCRAATAAAPG